MDIGKAQDVAALNAGLAAVAEPFGMIRKLHDTGTPKRVLLLVSKFHHCQVEPGALGWQSAAVQA
jgi:formyltetrahydrofolate hydrolase